MDQPTAEHFVNYGTAEEARQRAALMNNLVDSERQCVAALPPSQRVKHDAGFMNLTLYRYSAGEPVVSDACRESLGDAEVAKMGGLYRTKIT